ncbi:MAG: caspase family protein, partial [Planctomycetaceae bacterium]|nr:caspase family protein [Planctomycetaceae bacterium]
MAMLVGVNKYDRRGFNDLAYAERDVDELAVELQQQGFEVRLLKGSLAGPQRATRQNIRSALEELLKDGTSRDIVFLGFAGHGQQLPLQDEQGKVRLSLDGKPLEDAYFCPVDAVMGEQGSLIGLTNLVQTLDRKGGINLVMVDACRDNPDSSRSTRSITGNELNGRLPSNTAILFSCAAHQQALETKDAGGGHGV